MGITGYSAEHRAVSGEEVHETSSGNMQGIVHGRVLQGVCHHHHRGAVHVDGFNAERRIPRGTRAHRYGWQGRVIKCARSENLRLSEAGIVNFDFAGPEIGGQQKAASCVLDQRQAFEHRAGSSRRNLGIVHHQRYGVAARPGGERPVFRVKDEER